MTEVKKKIGMEILGIHLYMLLLYLYTSVS